jgi:hypothetical protein
VSGELWIEVVNWNKFQHYTDRRPAWIKNYTELLHNHNYIALSARHRGILHGLWLLYAAGNRELTASPAELNRALGFPSEWEDREDNRRWRELGESMASEWRGAWRERGESPLRMRDLKRLEHAGFIEIVDAETLAIARARDRERREENKPA